MARRKKTGLEQSDMLKLFHDLGKYVEGVTQVEIRKDRVFSHCVRASFAKCYEFNLHAWDEQNTASALFWLPTLRGICEDLIVLNFIQGIPSAERESLISDLFIQETDDSLRRQELFFKDTRPQQPCLSPFMSDSQLSDLEERLKQKWRSHGWPKFNKKGRPPTREMAAKSSGDILGTLYDYLYRMSSRTVHFSVTGLMRTGWGDGPRRITFSPKNFSRYYAAFGRIYGAYMFCAYFELFARFIRSDESTKKLVHEIRKSILRIPRWPEMVTFEEMNVEPPEIGFLQDIVSQLQAETQKFLLKS